jgi:hypothetical protein
VPDAHPDALLSSPSHYHMADKVALMSGLEDHQHLLADEQVTGSMQRQAALLLGRLGGDEHARDPVIIRINKRIVENNGYGLPPPVFASGPLAAQLGTAAFGFGGKAASLVAPRRRSSAILSALSSFSSGGT